MNASEAAAAVRSGGEATGVAAALTSMLVLGASFAAMEVLEAYPLALGQSMRYALGTVILVALARGRVRIPPRGVRMRLLVAAATGSVLFNALTLIAVQHANSGTVGVIVGTVPVAVALIGPLVAGSTPSLKLVGWASLATLGAALVQVGGGSVALLGVLCAVAATASEVVFLLIVDRLVVVLGPIGLAFWMCSIATLVFAAAGLVLGEPFAPISASDGLAIIYLGAGVSALALVLWNIGVVRLGAQRFSLFLAAVPVTSLLVGAALGQLRLTPLRALGMLLVAAAIAVGARAPARSPSNV